MTMIQCPKCGKISLRVVNVMATDETIHYACGNCCHKEKRPYGWDMEDKQKYERQATLGDRK